MALENKRNHYKASILKSAKYIDTLADDVIEDEISTHYEHCTESWRMFQEVHLEILLVTGDEFIPFQHAEYDNVETVIMNIIPRFKVLMKKFDNDKEGSFESAHSASVANDIINRNHGGLRVPYFKIPLFTGDYDAWPAFKDLFRSMIRDNNKMSSVQKLGYLKANLSDEPLKLIKNLEITDANYETAWTLLTDRYDNERMLVNRWIQLIMDIPSSKGSASDIKAILDGTQEALQGLKNLHRNIDGYDDFLVYLAETKLDQKSKQRWEDDVAKVQNTAPTWDQMVAFLKTRFRSLEVAHKKSVLTQEKSASQQNPTQNAKPSNQSKSPAGEQSSRSNPDDCCLFCKKKHRLNVCFTFQKKPFSERQAFVDEKRLCANCLNAGHKLASCPSSNTCRICQQHHHTLLHVTQLSSNVTSISDQASTTNHFSTLLATTLVHITNDKGAKIQLRALIDQGSQVSFITTNTASRLGLHGQPGGPSVRSVGMDNFLKTRGTTTLTFSSQYHDESTYNVTTTILDRITGQLPSEFIKIKLPPSWKHLPLGDPEFFKPGPIDALLGADVVSAVIEEGLMRMTDHSIIAQKTTLGWLLSGKVKLSNPIPVAVTGILTDEDKEYENLNRQLSAFWEIENIGPGNAFDQDDQICEDHFRSTHYRDENGRFVVRLPFKPSFRSYIHLGNSRNIAICNWLSMEKRIDKSPQLKATYDTIMDRLIEMNYMQLIPSTELQVSPQESCYLVHHIVKRGGKNRIVFNASKKTSSGFSLNDALLIGPPLQKDLFGIILHVRQFRIAFSTDVVKMFRQFVIHNSDVDFQRFVYRKSKSEEIQHYRLATVLDGTACASYLANKIIQTLAADERSRYPLACAIAERDMYVDDLLSGCHDIETGIEIRNQLNSLFRSAGMELSKWSSNDKRMLESLPDNLLETSIELGDEDVIKTLGIFWSPHKDEFRYRIRMDEIQGKVTKRQLLSEASKLFDPVGWVSPCIIIPKMLFQSLWSIKLGWDDFVPQDIQNKWLEFRAQLPQLEKLKIPRWTGNQTNDKLIELHGFSDASEKAYAAVVFLKVVDADDKINITMLTAKTKVAPIKTISLPSLELCGSLLLAHLIEKVVKSMNFNDISVHAHTDSQIVLAWLQSRPSRWKTFVANRTSEILRIVPTNHWHYVRSEQNPADCASRGVYPTDLLTHSLWWKGPSWLANSTVSWPFSHQAIQMEISAEMEERNSVLVHGNFVVEPTWELKSKYSSLTKLLRVSAYCWRFINNCRTAVKATGCINANELDSALRYWIKVTQAIHFKNELNSLKAGKEIHKTSHIINLRPMLDSFDVIRVGGRLINSTLPYERQHPIILPKNDHLVTLLLDYYLKKTLHGNIQLMLNIIRDKYWILTARSVVRNWVHKCNRCYRFSAKPLQQLMGDLPSARVTPSRIFSHSTIDYAGPINIKMRNGPGKPILFKSYISIFVCMATKAIHLELVGSLTSDAFISAFKRFVSRRGHITDIYSDNGSNFVGAVEIMSESHRLAMIDTEIEFSELLANDGVKWHFNPPSAPHFNGLAEAGVRSTKYHLRRIVGSAHLTYEELNTVLCQIEAVLNSRPISALTDDFSDFTVLTPGHFLLGAAPISVPEAILMNINENRLSRWQLMEKMHQDFWKSWSTEYLASMQQRPRWQSIQDNLSVGQMVIIRQDNMPPTKWLLGRIEAIHPGDDGLVRVATVRTQNSTLKRPIVKLCPLPSPNLPELEDQVQE